MYSENLITYTLFCMAQFSADFEKCNKDMI